MTAHIPYSEKEDKMIIAMREYGYTYEYIAERLRARGYPRLATSIRRRYTMIKDQGMEGEHDTRTEKI